jgi:hypothetical protein
VIRLKLDTNAQFPHEAAHGENVVYQWKVFQLKLSCGKQRRRHRRQCGVLGAADVHRTFEAGASSDS